MVQSKPPNTHSKMRKLVVVSCLAMVIVLFARPSVASDCWKVVIPVGKKSADGKADLFSGQIVAVESNKDSALLKARQEARALEDKDGTNISGTPDIYQVSCEGDPSKTKSPSAARSFIEQAVEKGLCVLAIGRGFEPKSIILAVVVKEGTMKVMDAYDRDRGDVKAFLEKVGVEVSPDKLKEWLNDPANSFERSDLGKAANTAKEDFNRSDLSKATGIKF
jgi:hypothetical protein